MTQVLQKGSARQLSQGPASIRQLSDFLGRWTLSRQIDQADGQNVQFEGTAIWRPQGDAASYEEQGWLTMGQQCFQAERRYHWGRDLKVFFEDGRFFHQVPSAGGATGHWCDPDQYDVTYDFALWPHWHCSWRVAGPRKRYVMTSTYSPL